MRLIKAFAAVIYGFFYFVYSLLDSFADWGCICFENDCWPWQIGFNDTEESEDV